MKILTRPLKIKEVTETGAFAGYGSVFGNEDFYGEVVEKGAFLKSLTEKGASGIKLLWQHRQDEPIGFYTKLLEDEHGLYVEGQLLIDDDPLARRAWGHLKAGSVDGLSVGYRTVKSRFDHDNENLYLAEVDLWEVSIVTFAANTLARVSDVKTPRQLESFLRDEGGFSRNEAKAIVADGFGGLKRQRDAGGQSGNVSDALARLANSLSN